MQGISAPLTEKANRGRLPPYVLVKVAFVLVTIASAGILNPPAGLGTNQLLFQAYAVAFMVGFSTGLITLILLLLLTPSSAASA